MDIPSNDHLVYIHPIKWGNIAGFHYLVITEDMGKLFHCAQPPIGALNVWYRSQIHCIVYNGTNTNSVSQVTNN